jgi:hypothetical protein
MSTGAGEERIFREKSVAGMNGISSAALRGIEDSIDIQIRFSGRRRANQIGVISDTNVEGGAVYLRVNRRRGDSHLVAGADHAHGDLATIRNQDFLKHPWKQDKVEILVLRRRQRSTQFY